MKLSISAICIICMALICCGVSGCATNRAEREEILARLMSDTDTRSESSSIDRVSRDVPTARVDTTYGGSDGPDRPVSGLPSMDLLNEGTRDTKQGTRDTARTRSGGVESSGKMPDLSDQRRTAARGMSELTIQPDSIVQISVEEDSTLDGSYPVNDIGAVDLSYIGPVILLNKSEEEASAKISEVLVARDFRQASVQVKILRASYDRVRISGAVGNPGLIRIGAGDNISLNNALLRAGGIQASAKGAKIRIIRDGLLSAVGNELEGEEYTLVDADGKPSVPDVVLDNNDVARVFSSEAKASVVGGDKEILVVGEVSRPGMYRFVGGEPCTIMHLIFKMGGLPPYANKKKITIKRVDEDGYASDIEVDAERILKDGNPDDDIPLQNGDRVIVPARRLSLF